MDEAVKEAAQVVSADPTQVETVGLISSLYNSRGDKAKAQEVLEQGVKSNPKNIELRLQLAQLAAGQKHMATAER